MKCNTIHLTAPIQFLDVCLQGNCGTLEIGNSYFHNWHFLLEGTAPLDWAHIYMCVPKTPEMQKPSLRTQVEMPFSYLDFMFGSLLKVTFLKFSRANF